MEGDVMGSVKMMSLMAPKPASKQAGKDSKGEITDDDDSDVGDVANERQGDFMGSHHDEKRSQNMTQAFQWATTWYTLRKPCHWYP